MDVKKTEPIICCYCYQAIYGEVKDYRIVTKSGFERVRFLCNGCWKENSQGWIRRFMIKQSKWNDPRL